MNRLITFLVQSDGYGATAQAGDSENCCGDLDLHTTEDNLPRRLARKGPNNNRPGVARKKRLRG